MSEKVTAMIEEIKGLTVLELSELFTLWRRSSAFPPLPWLLLLPALLLPLLRRRPTSTSF